MFITGIFAGLENKMIFTFHSSYLYIEVFEIKKNLTLWKKYPTARVIHLPCWITCKSYCGELFFDIKVCYKNAKFEKKSLFNDNIFWQDLVYNFDRDELFAELILCIIKQRCYSQLNPSLMISAKNIMHKTSFKKHS